MGPAFTHHLVLNDSGTRAIATNVRNAAAPPALALGLLRFLDARRDEAFAVQTLSNLELPAPLGPFDSVAVFSARAALPYGAYPRVAKSVGWAVLSHRCEVSGHENVAMAELRKKSLGIDPNRALAPVLDARHELSGVAGGKSKGGGKRFLHYDRPDRLFRGLHAKWPKADAGSWIELRNYRMDVLRAVWNGAGFEVSGPGQPIISREQLPELVERFVRA